MRDVADEARRQLTTRRIMSGLSQEALGHRMDTSQSGVSALESGRSGLTLRTLSRWSGALGLRVRIVLEEDPDRD